MLAETRSKGKPEPTIAKSLQEALVICRTMVQVNVMAVSRADAQLTILAMINLVMIVGAYMSIMNLVTTKLNVA